jgi:hypothetical protein
MRTKYYMYSQPQEYIAGLSIIPLRKRYFNKTVLSAT